MIYRLSLRRLRRMTAAVVHASWRREPAADEYRGTEFEVPFRRRGRAQVIRGMNNGESPLTPPPLLYRIHPGAPTVLAPPPE